MNTREAYNSWSSQYDTNENKTRDLEARALREQLKNIPFERCLEIGCGTGKNTVWLTEKASHVTAIDLSENMIAKAKEKVDASKVDFLIADITKPCDFVSGSYDLVSFSLVLEHIEDLDPIFEKTAASLKSGGHVYIGELHPFKQYTGSKARFDTEQGHQIVTCFDHHISDFIVNAGKHGLTPIDIGEYFDDDDRNNIPRILTIVFKKN